MTRTYSATMVIGCALIASCGGNAGPGGSGEDTDAITLSDSLSTATPTSGGSTGDDSDDSDDSNQSNSNSESNTNPTQDPSATDSNASDSGLIFDVGDGGFCQVKDAGVYCTEENRVAITCGEMNDQISQEPCSPGTCLEGTGCVTCLEGQFDCHGPRVMQCDTSVPGHQWTEVEVCDPAASMVCSIPMGSCIPNGVVGDATPTGEYYQYAYFGTGDTAYLGGYDVDSFDNRLYVVSLSQTIDVYEVDLLDSDGDGAFEPNQHPLNPEETGPIEERTITFLESIPPPMGVSLGASTTELLALEDRLYIGGTQLTEYIFATGATQVITTPPGFLNRFSQIAYDDVNQGWYASSESARRVFQHDAATNTWGLSFDYPELAGSHMDGLEVVTQPETGIPYVYVSDMTSDFIGQYRKDPNLGWVQENLFSYEGNEGDPVEGMGFGYLNHFWATSGSAVYEVGGGDLQEFVEPPG